MEPLAGQEGENAALAAAVPGPEAASVGKASLLSGVFVRKTCRSRDQVLGPAAGAAGSATGARSCDIALVTYISPSGLLFVVC